MVCLSSDNNLSTWSWWTREKTTSVTPAGPIFAAARVFPALVLPGPRASTAPNVKSHLGNVWDIRSFGKAQPVRFRHRARRAKITENWPVVAHQTIRRLRTKSARQGNLDALDEAADAHAPYAHPCANSQHVVRTILRLGGKRLSMFGAISPLGSPRDVTLEELKVELFFPTDTATESRLTHLFGQ